MVRDTIDIAYDHSPLLYKKKGEHDTCSTNDHDFGRSQLAGWLARI
mgnify:CR=1 FL=1